MVSGFVVQGHGVASGIGTDPRYPKGTLWQQAPYFSQAGLDMSGFYRGTINLDIRPFAFVILDPKHYFQAINWSPFIPPENFYFFELIAHYKDKVYEGLIYMPDPETKTDHPQDTQILELLLPKISGLNYGDHLKIQVPKDQLKFYKSK